MGYDVLFFVFFLCERGNVEKRFLKLFCKLPGAIMGQDGRSGRFWEALGSHDNFFEPDVLLTPVQMRTGLHIPFGQENSYFFVTTIFKVKK